MKDLDTNLACRADDRLEFVEQVNLLGDVLRPRPEFVPRSGNRCKNSTKESGDVGIVGQKLRHSGLPRLLRFPQR
jgi:hypothetical protein